VNPCVILMRVSELGCWALIVFAFESNSVRRQVGYLTLPLMINEWIYNRRRVYCF